MCAGPTQRSGSYCIQREVMHAGAKKRLLVVAATLARASRPENLCPHSDCAFWQGTYAIVFAPTPPVTGCSHWGQQACTFDIGCVWNPDALYLGLHDLLVLECIQKSHDFIWASTPALAIGSRAARLFACGQYQQTEPKNNSPGLHRDKPGSKALHATLEPLVHKILVP